MARKIRRIISVPVRIRRLAITARVNATQNHCAAVTIPEPFAVNMQLRAFVCVWQYLTPSLKLITAINYADIFGLKAYQSINPQSSLATGKVVKRS